MKVEIDAAAADAFSLVAARAYGLELRRYYATSSGPRALLVCRNGLLLSDLRGAVVDAACGWDHGEAGFVWRPGERHTKITVYKRVRGKPETTLSALLRSAPWGDDDG
ncbi:MAG TPA: hypothetical protein PLQ85_10540 [Anaerolineae bacterium]|nr:hypothetical protein [Anaerolineae bacterium]